MTTIILSWPPRTLSPNGRAHWRKLSAAKKIAKQEAWAVTKAANLRAPADESPVHVALTFYPKTRNRVDADNLIASMKASLDGIAEALGCDDSRFRLAAPIIADPVKGGRVEVALS